LVQVEAEVVPAFSVPRQQTLMPLTPQMVQLLLILHSTHHYGRHFRQRIRRQRLGQLQQEQERLEALPRRVRGTPDWSIQRFFSSSLEDWGVLQVVMLVFLLVLEAWEPWEALVLLRQLLLTQGVRRRDSKHNCNS
jgi:hypothetical protein